MKKTIIALMALSGAATAADFTGSQVDEWIKASVTSSALNNPDYILEFTISDTYAWSGGDMLLKLNNTNWQIRQQVGRYLGLGEGDTVAGDYSSRVSGQTSTGNHYIDLDTAGTGDTADYNGWFYDGGTGNAIRGITFKIQADSYGSEITMSTADESCTITLQRNGKVVLGGLDFGHNGDAFISSASLTLNPGENQKTYALPAAAVPEPTTATLGLLALAGLAAHRRRK